MVCLLAKADSARVADSATIVPVKLLRRRATTLMKTKGQEHSLQLGAAEEAALQLQWQELAASYGADAQVVQAVWLELLNNYATTTRHYHNLSHIKALLNWVDLSHAHLQQPAAVRFAVWFHDVIYNTRRQNNEERSAEFARQELSHLNVPVVTINAVSAMILATKQHRAETLDEDGRWFLDFDLAILGSRPDVYRVYSQAIRREYAWVPKLLYRRGRRQVLEGFLQREQLFFTEAMRTRLEAQARLNLAEELASL
jgi:predicted metal-dependent HD superfamily phosphohydrolase